jgi:hypothetical protein
MSNFVGFSIIPRFATEIYFNCSTRANNTALYNSLQRIILNNPSLPAVDFATLLDREARRVSLNMLLLRADPHMMHQANLVVESSATTRWGPRRRPPPRLFDCLLRRAPGAPAPRRKGRPALPAPRTPGAAPQSLTPRHPAAPVAPVTRAPSASPSSPAGWRSCSSASPAS